MAVCVNLVDELSCELCKYVLIVIIAIVLSCPCRLIFIYTVLNVFSRVIKVIMLYAWRVYLS